MFAVVSNNIRFVVEISARSHWYQYSEQNAPNVCVLSGFAKQQTTINNREYFRLAAGPKIRRIYNTDRNCGTDTKKNTHTHKPLDYEQNGDLFTNSRSICGNTYVCVTAFI